MNKKKTIVLLVIAILVVTTMSIGVTYSYMKNKTSGNTETEIGINNCAKITLKDNDSTINLTNMYPMEEEMGLQTDAYEFTVSSTCEEYTGFNLYLLTYEKNEIEDSLIRYGITSKNDTLLETNLITTEKASDIATQEIEEINQGVNKGYNKIYKVYSNNIPLKGESEYKLHIWIDENASNETMDKNIKLGVLVKGYKREETMAEYIIAHKDNTLIYHDGSIKDEEGNITDAFDYSYRYAGASDIVNNFVCLDGGETATDDCANGDVDLYRIIGLFKNEQNLYELKLIKYDYATINELGLNGTYSGSSYSFGSAFYKGNIENFPNIGGYYWSAINKANSWIDSVLRKTNLNDFYLNTYLKTTKNIDIDKLITMHTWSLNGHSTDYTNLKIIYNSEMNNETLQTKTVNDNIGLMYVSDYGYAADPTSTNNWSDIMHDSATTYTSYKLNNWLYMGLSEWTISPNTSTNNIAFGISGYGYLATYSVNTGAHGIRPCFYLNSNVIIQSGDGTKDNPYRISI